MKLRLIATAALFMVAAVSVYGAPFPNIQQDVGVCDPYFPDRCIKPDINGAVPITGSISATTSATATAAAPTYVEGTSNPLSIDLAGGLRITGTINATSAATATVAAPAYVEGTANPFSQNLTGDLRTIAKQSGTWNIATVTAVTGITNALPAGTNVIGHVIVDATSTTLVTQPTAASLNATVVGTGTFVVQATLAAETTKVIGTVNQGTSPWVVSGTVTTTPPSNASTNVAQLAGTTTDTNSGVKSAGTLRVVIATDQPQLTNKLLVTPDSVALPANQSVNVSQINAVTPLMGNGVTGTGSQRVTIASDNTAFSVNATLAAETTKVIGTVRVLGNAGAIVDGVNTAATAPANGVLGLGIFNTTEPSPTTGQSVGIQLDSKGRVRQVLMDAAGNTRGANVNASSQLSVSVDNANVSANVAQINGVVPLMGNGATGTGSLRVTLASDTTSNSNPLLINGNVTPADAAALGTTSNRAYALGGLYNGATVDMQREVANSTNSVGTGITAAGLLGQCDDTSPTALTENQFGNARVDCATHAQLVTTVPSATAGGTTLTTLTLANTTNATNVKASAGQLYSISGFNMSSATPVWISLYNNAGTPTCGTAIIQQFMIPGNTTGAGFVYDFATPKGFSSGIAFCATTGIAGTGAPAATTYVLNVDYK